MTHTTVRLTRLDRRETPAVFPVSTTADSGTGSLRDAITQANAAAGPDTVTFNANVTGTITLLSEITVNDPLTITGPGAKSLTLSGGNAARPLYLVSKDSATAMSVSISGLTFANGAKTGTGTSTVQGGAILAQSVNLTLTNCNFFNNTTQSNGGALFIEGLNNGSLTVTGCVFDSNKSTGAAYLGGAIGIDKVPTATISTSTFTRNSADSGGAVGAFGALTLNLTDSAVGSFTDGTLGNTAAAGGGGIYLFNASTLNVQRSVISGNTAGGDGGGTMQYNGGQLSVQNSTISGNTAGTTGGGVYFYSQATTPLSIVNSTISNNKAGIGGGINLVNFKGQLNLQNTTVALNQASAQGGGVFHGESGGGGTGTVTLTSTIVAQNTAGTGPDFKGDVVAFNSVIGNTSGALVDASSKDNLLNTNPQLDTALSLNGATATPTLALKAGSPAIDKGSNPLSLSFDQRGSGFARVVGTAADVGAFEVQAVVPPVTATVVTDDGSKQRSVVRSFTVNFSQAVTFPGGAAAAFQLARTGPASGFASTSPTGSVTGLAFSTAAAAVTITFTDDTFAPANQGRSLIDGNYTLTLVAANISGGGGFDGNGDGTPGDNQSLATHRLFGDADGDRDVDFNDFLQFRSAFGSTGPNPPYNRVFDYDGNNTVDFNDFLQFRTRFGQTLQSP